MSEGAGTEIPFEGVESLDHTADVGLEVEADHPAELFARAALGMTYLILEGPLPEGEEERTVEVEGLGPEGLLRNWLREVLYLHEAEGFAVSGVTFRRLEAPANAGEEELSLEATLRGGEDPAQPAREIKGVTWHGLLVEEREGRWFARVIFDV